MQLLLEIGCEELPAASVYEAEAQLPALCERVLGVAPERVLVGPRRLAVLVSGLEEETETGGSRARRRAAGEGGRRVREAPPRGRGGPGGARRLPRRRVPATVTERGPARTVGRDHPRPPVRKDDALGRVGTPVSAADPVDLRAPRRPAGDGSRHETHGHRSRTARWMSPQPTPIRTCCGAPTSSPTRPSASGGSARGSTRSASGATRSASCARSSTWSSGRPSSKGPSTSAFCRCRNA